MTFIHKFFSADGFMAHGHCYLRETHVMWLHIISDTLITLTYLTIAVTLIYVARKRKDLPFNWMFACFGIFILARGVSHAFEVVTIWEPLYRLSDTIEAMTAAASVAAAILLVKFIPQLLSIPGIAALREANMALEREVRERQRTEHLLRMAARIGRLGAWSVELPSHAQTWSDEVCALYEIPPGTVVSFDEAINSFEPESRARLAMVFEICARDGVPYDVELQMIKPDGRLRWVRAIGEAERNAAGVICRVQGALQDIADRKVAEEALDKSELRYKSLFENMLEGYAYCQLSYRNGQPEDYTYLEINGAFQRLTGLKNVTGRKVSEVIPGVHESNPKQLAICSRVAASGQPEQLEAYVESLDIWFSISIYSHEKEHFIAIFNNITDRQKSEATLVDTARRLQLATEVSGTGVWDWDVRTNEILWDAQMFSLHGLTPREVTYDLWESTVHPEDIDEQSAILQETVRTCGRSERQFRIRRVNDGAVRVIYASEMVVRGAAGEAVRVVGVNRDITDFEISTAKLAASEELLNQFIKHTPAAIAMLDTEMRYMNASDRWLKDYHLAARDIIGRSHYEIFPDIQQHWMDIHQRVLAGAVEKRDEIPFPRADGGMEWLQWEARPWHQADGEIGGLVFYTQVITARKVAEGQLRESEERFRGAFENSAIGMALVSLEGRWMRVNSALCKIVGRTVDELLSCTFQDITHPDDLDADLAQVRALLAGEIDHYQMEKRYFHKAGHIVWILLAATLVRASDGSAVHFVSQIEDITDRKETARRIQASLEEKEVLLREIHHRVKNNMQVITSLLQLQSGYLHDPRDAEIFQNCQARIHSMGLVHDRLYHSGNLATINFSEHLRDLTTYIVRGHVGTSDRIRLVVESESVQVNLDVAIPLGLIVTELITNTHKHAFRDRADGLVTVRLFRTGEGQLLLTVEDDGVGLPDGFDPETARTLGLRLIRSLVRQMRAEFSIASTSTGCRMALQFSI